MISFIGLGKLGLTCAETFAEKYTVKGYDIEERQSVHVQICPSLGDAIEGSKFIFIAVQTPHDPSYDGSAPTTHLEPKNFDYSRVIEVLKNLNGLVKENQIVCLISTVLPGTIRSVLYPYIEGMRFVYNPYLIAMGSVRWDMINPEMIIMGGHDEDALMQLREVYKTISRNPRIVAGTWEEAESIKIFYNTFITMKLTLVNMIQDVAEKLGHMSVDTVTKALSDSHKRIMGPSYMYAGMGDGGPCHPRDNIALSWLAKELDLGYDMFNNIMRAREIQAKNMAIKLTSFNLPVIIIGKSYKPAVSYLEGSPSLLVGHYVALKQKVYYYDEFFEKPPQEILNQPAVYLIAHSHSATYHTRDENPILDYSTIPAGSVIVDPWRKCKSYPGIKVIHYGDTRW